MRTLYDLAELFCLGSLILMIWSACLIAEDNTHEKHTDRRVIVAHGGK